VSETLKLVQRTLSGDASAWTALQAALEPIISTMVRRHAGLRRKGLADRLDDVAEVRTVVLERLAHNDFLNLRSYVARIVGCTNPQSFEGWLYGNVDYAVLDHLRNRFGRAPKRTAFEVGRILPSKRDLQSCAGRLEDDAEREPFEVAGVTTRLTLAEIGAYIENALSAEEAEAVRLHYVESRTFEEIATALGLEDARAANQLIRRLTARLRYRFAARSAEPC
jgi:DNA-directed RNA polymerase specialized sigma24 family protein